MDRRRGIRRGGDVRRLLEEVGGLAAPFFQMQMIELENISLPRYDNVPLARGDLFMAKASDAKVLVLAGLCKVQVIPAHAYRTAAGPKPEPDPEPDPDVSALEISPRTGRPKRVYRRRDMVPQR